MQEIMTSKDISINLIQFQHGQNKDGVQEGPEYLIRAGLCDKLSKLGLNVVSKNQLQCDYSCEKTKIELCSQMCQKISSTVHDQSKKKQFCLNIGGDHSIATGTISGMLKTYPDLCVLWIDAHTDLNRVDTSPSGSVHGMPVSFILNDHREKALKAVPTEYQWCRGSLLQPSHLAYIGIRQMDSGEIETVRDLNICTYDMVTIDRLGIHECITCALRKIDPTCSKPLHVSFDIDSIDPSFIPCTGTPVKGGLTMREILYISECVNNTGRLVSLDVVEFNPKMSNEIGLINLTAKNTMSVIKSFFGKKRPFFN
ncbi:hypothetical protein HZS_6462 [Henneguya salminicola]|uniref:Arginase n=1 Tax=Henneguya salminicola TaxID=69463 RepID=A0A6G3MGQ0_HENSL|nr:hypothetical protein HZS_6462 [Henneguya salminicola]